MANKLKIKKYFQQADELFKQKELHQAEKIYKKILTTRPGDVDVLSKLSIIAYQHKKYDVAKAHLERANKIQPDNYLLHARLGKIFLLMGDIPQAEEFYLRSIELNQDYIDVYCMLSDLYIDINRLDKALLLLDKALDGRQNSKLLSLQAFCFSAEGKFEKAIEAYRVVLARDPADSSSMRMLAALVKHNSLDDEILSMLALLESEKITDEDRIQLNFGLGKSYEDLQQYEKSFKYFQEGNFLKRMTFDYQGSDFDVYINKLCNVFDRELFQKTGGIGDQGKSLIFIVGMPRSGSTLVEQIISSHRDVCAEGETDGLNKSIFRQDVLDISGYPESVVKLDSEVIKKMAANYMESIRNSEGKRYITDKTLINFIHIGMIILMFPKAKIIHCVRDAMSICLSCFQILFTTGQKYSYNLREMGQYYLSYQRLMAHWHSILPGKIYNIEYERLISNQKDETEKLLKHCGLEWDDNCLQFKHSGRAVTTASIWQVRQGIYKDSLARWLPFKKYLKPLIGALEIK